MPTYLYRCAACGRTFERNTPDLKTSLCEATGEMAAVRRDWKAEGANVNIENIRAVKRSSK